jgi:Zn-dependent protease with chaperone function
MATSYDLIDNFRVNVGRYYDGSSARPRRVDLAIAGDALRILPDHGPAEIWPASELSYQGEVVAGQWFVLACGTSAARLYLPPRMYERLTEAFGRPARRSRLRWIRPLVLPVGAVLVWLMIIIGFLLPILAEQMAQWRDSDTSVRIGWQTLENHLGRLERRQGKVKFCVDPAGQKALIQLKAVMTALSPSFTPEIVVVQRQQANGVSTGGGYMVLTSGLIDMLQSETELLGVIAHEIGHSERRHGLRKMIETSSLIAFSGLVFNTDALTIGYTLTGWSTGLPQRSRVMEREADQFAVQFLKRANLDPAALGDLMRRFAEDDGRDRGFLGSHPSYTEREETFRRAAMSGYRILTGDQWRSLKRLCSKTTTSNPLSPP